jgi:hypothetical protein
MDVVLNHENGQSGLLPDHDSDGGPLLCSDNNLGGDVATALAAPLESLTGLQSLDLRCRVRECVCVCVCV